VDETIQTYFVGNSIDITNKFADEMIEAVNEVTHSCKKVLSVRKSVTNKNSMVLLELSKGKVYS